MIPTEKDIQEGIRRIALTPDGMLLYRRLQVELMSVLPAGAESGALHEHTGRRRFAHDLKVLMDQELAKTGIERDRTVDHDPDRPAVFRQSEPVDAGAERGKRRVEPYPGQT
jgi:hypothetical protein